MAGLRHRAALGRGHAAVGAHVGAEDGAALAGGQREQRGRVAGRRVEVPVVDDHRRVGPQRPAGGVGHGDVGLLGLARPDQALGDLQEAGPQALAAVELLVEVEAHERDGGDLREGDEVARVVVVEGGQALVPVQHGDGARRGRHAGDRRRDAGGHVRDRCGREVAALAVDDRARRGHGLRGDPVQAGRRVDADGLDDRRRAPVEAVDDRSVGVERAAHRPHDRDGRVAGHGLRGGRDLAQRGQAHGAALARAALLDGGQAAAEGGGEGGQQQLAVLVGRRLQARAQETVHGHQGR